MSFNGRTAGFDPVNRSSILFIPTNYCRASKLENAFALQANFAGFDPLARYHVGT